MWAALLAVVADDGLGPLTQRPKAKRKTDE
jgi:hypothetical protein